MTPEAPRRLLEGVSSRPPRSDDPKIDGLSPWLVLEPENEAALSRALELCHRESLAVVPVGSGTRLSLGNRPSHLDAFLSTRALDGVVDHIPSDLTVTVRAGTRVGTLQEELFELGQFLPVDPPLPDRATVGGVFALAEPGFRRRPGGRPRDLLLGFEGVLADGTVVKSGGRVVKNVAGYELSKLFTGSAGTLVVMTRAHLRLRALPEEVVTVSARFRRAGDARSAWHELNRSHSLPEAAALLNPASSRASSLADWSLVLRFEGLSEEVSASVEAAVERLRGAARISSRVWDWIRDFPLGATGSHVLVLRGQVAPALTFELAEEWRDGGPLVAHPDSGLVFSRTEEPDGLSDRQEVARRLGANVVLEQAPPGLKEDMDVFGEPPKAFAIMRRLKQELDPRGILSPGRFVGRL
ncbi:MAG TPA: FAD-binding oxidoreductase [Vicinamibacteria bacterium]|nr:FAD-binding oxidoreductase [Vicinamibacteria bacterium]